ncbi:hypothetical protein CANARDRAFT_27212 [[Candida] arabinofermentans NRRL YB-2248]|uniref:Pyrroline-5-carboxylate reductase n=1 Tax=[Candida] arabinofermentans NRRL YB-2248 TaxID=983967 RepID=A0A1E4T4Y8_9ASCO|nr:hypothetical protein CANARDRAFT_27212 [[Candida] arabinofermentans NRRL YB-2248]
MSIDLKNYTLTILGCGEFGTVFLSLVLQSPPEFLPSRIICCTSSESSAVKLQSTYGDKIETSYGSKSNKDAVWAADVLVLGCKPDIFPQIALELELRYSPARPVISLMAGWMSHDVTQYIGSGLVARVITSAAASSGCGTVAVSFNESNKKFEDLVMNLIDKAGFVLKVQEKNMDAATAVAGSASAFCLLMMEALADGALMMGLPYDSARQFASHVMEGTARWVSETGGHPATMKNGLCTPGGTTIAGLLVLEDKGVRGAVSRAVQESAKVATALGKKPEFDHTR